MPADFSLESHMVLKLLPQRKKDVLQFARTSHTLLIFGTLLDEVSTWLVIESGKGFEANPYVVSLMQNGLWLLYDLVIIILSIKISLYCYKRWGRWELLYFPLLYGSIRLLLAFHNFLIFI